MYIVGRGVRKSQIKEALSASRVNRASRGRLLDLECNGWNG